MNGKKILFLAFAIVLGISSCQKEEEFTTNKTNNGEEKIMSVDPIEANILNFIERMDAVREDPDIEDALEWNYSQDSAVWYLEAVLNYKYVNYDYSKCENDTTFTGEQNFDDKSTYNIVELQELYDIILNDWRDKYYTVDDETRTPIAFVIEPYESSIINYTMVVCYGEIDLDEYSDELFLVPGTIRYDIAAQMLGNRMFNHLNNSNITLGYRTYFTPLGYHWEEPDLNNSPPFPLNVNDPTPGDQYIDYLFWFIDKSLPSGYHFLLHDWEYDYHESAYFNFVNDFIVSMPGANACSYSDIGIEYIGDYNPFASPPEFPDKMWHEPLIVYGVRRYTSSNLSTL